MGFSAVVGSLAPPRYRASARVQAEWADRADANQSEFAAELAERRVAAVRQQVLAAVAAEKERLGAQSAAVSVRSAADDCFLVESEHSDPVTAAQLSNRLAARLVEEAERDGRAAGQTERGALATRLAAARQAMEEAKSALVRSHETGPPAQDALPTLERLVREYEEARRSYFEVEQLLTAAEAPSRSGGSGRVRFTLLSRAFPPSAPIELNLALLAAVGAVVGLVAGLGLAVLAQARDPSVKGPEDLAELLPYPILVEVPIIKVPRSARRSKGGSPGA
jgi:hypothetical protein